MVDPGPLVVKVAESLVGIGLTHNRPACPAPQLRKPGLIAAITAK